MCILGPDLKAGKDELRESASVDLNEKWLLEGKDLRDYVENINLARDVEVDRDYIIGRIPYVALRLADSVGSALRCAEVVVSGNGTTECDAIGSFLGKSQRRVDLIG